MNDNNFCFIYVTIRCFLNAIFLIFYYSFAQLEEKEIIIKT